MGEWRAEDLTRLSGRTSLRNKPKKLRWQSRPTAGYTEIASRSRGYGAKQAFAVSMGDRSPDVSCVRGPDDDLARARTDSWSDHQVAAHLAWQCGTDHLGDRALHFDLLAARRANLGADGRAARVPHGDMAARNWADPEFVLHDVRRPSDLPRDPGSRFRRHDRAARYSHHAMVRRG